MNGLLLKWRKKETVGNGLFACVPRNCSKHFNIKEMLEWFFAVSHAEDWRTLGFCNQDKLNCLSLFVLIVSCG